MQLLQNILQILLQAGFEPTIYSCRQDSGAYNLLATKLEMNLFP